MKNLSPVRVETSDNKRLWALVATVIMNQKCRRSYRREFREFCKFLGVEPGTEAAAQKLVGIKIEHATLYKEFLSRQMGEPTRGAFAPEPLAPATIIKRLAIMRSFYKTFHNEGIASSNPFALIKAPTLSHRKRPTKMIQFDQLDALFQAPGLTSPRGVRDTAILVALLACGLRRSELVKLNIQDLRRDSDGIAFFYLRDTKNGTFAEQVISSWAEPHIERWRLLRAAKVTKGDGPLFCTLASRGAGAQLERSMSTSSVYKMFKKYIESIGLNPKDYSPHSCRTTAVSWLLSKGYNHSRVAEFSRHGSTQMVDVYDDRFFGRKDSLGLMVDFSDSMHGGEDEQVF